jgi:hypothetical protein
MKKSTTLEKEQIQLLEQGKRRQDLLSTYATIQRTQGPDKAREWYECWVTKA